ncbi:MAG: xanthine dehydrogenase family protein molybdopterin-binding subunit [Alphaproteobacteria bacterium]|nr:xanthine dehydrogenase family protein molybdopterin-binding subunit [Alphaproteobacteria bacterium]
MERFGIGQPVRRREDRRFITGAGRFTDDIDMPGQAYGYVLRSPHAHARLRSIDTGAARTMPGVLGVFTIGDLDVDGVAEIPTQVDVPGRGGAKMFAPTRPVLARDIVRYAGEPVAYVVAETLHQAHDAAEAIHVDYEALPAVVDLAAADKPGAPLLYPERGSNLCVHWESHDGADVEAAFAGAHTVVALDFVNNRIVGNPMEPRVAIGEWDAEAERYTLHSPTQGVIRIQNGLANIAFKVPKPQVRVVSPDVGGGFGLRGKLFPESVLVLWAAKRLGRPVKWRADRHETFFADVHGRDHVTHGEMGFDAKGHILGVRIRTIANVGAYLSDNGPRVPTVAGARVAGTVYDVPALQLSVRVTFTNTVPVCAYRGAGRPEIAYQMERLLDQGAHELGLGRDEIRRRNFIRPEQLPYKNRVGMVIDSGHFQQTMELALEKADWAGFEARRAEARGRGRLRGIGLGYYIEASGGQPTEQAQVRLTPEGRVQLIMGTFSHGQGHETAFSQIVAQKLGVPFEDIDFLQGDTAFVANGNGTGGSRSSQMGGVASARACDQIVEKAKRLAAHALEAAAADIAFRNGVFEVAGTDLRMTLREVAALAQDPARLPEGDMPGLDETCLYKRPTECNFPNGAHVAEIEIEADTGRVEIVKYTAIDDCGVIINPLLVAGQVHGGVCQGLGQAVLEHTAYDLQSGQFLAASFMDYAMPRAEDMPFVEVGFNPVRNPSNELGVKGIGEGGACGAPPAIVSAVADALRDRGIRHLDMPLTPESVWRALRATESRAGAD